ncbi:hypothetical protein WG66_013271 [Moniliophthora roreri]|nr:hypothetical protein WG66_013271 [Moniliophthora roreri]
MEGSLPFSWIGSTAPYNRRWIRRPFGAHFLVSSVYTVAVWSYQYQPSSVRWVYGDAVERKCFTGYILTSGWIGPNVRASQGT